MNICLLKATFLFDGNVIKSPESFCHLGIHLETNLSSEVHLKVILRKTAAAIP